MSANDREIATSVSFGVTNSQIRNPRIIRIDYDCFIETLALAAYVSTKADA